MRSCLLLVCVMACQPPGYGKGDPGDPVDAAVVPTTDGSSDASSGAVCEQAFRLDGRSTASSVWLSGDFVAWGGTPGLGAIAFALGADGAWTGTYSFEPGPHQYKFIVSGTEWITDPTNPDQIDDGTGNRNSLFTCAP